jgi:hypothetical protein
LRAAKAFRIGIDGIDGSGKSTLAKVVATHLDLRLFSLDDYLERDKGSFLEFSDYPQLRADVSLEKGYVIEGMCLLYALQRAGLAIDALVYVKRRHLGLWADERELDLNESLDDFLESERRLIAMVTRKSDAVANLGLAEEVICYHYAARTHNNAHVIYFRDEH